MNYQQGGRMDGQGYPGQGPQQNYYQPMPNMNNDQSRYYPTPDSFSSTPHNQSQYMNDPLQNFQGRAVAEAAIFYGSKIVGTGREMVDEKIKKYKSIYMIRHYFAVDTSYVLNKLKLIIFPYSNKDWSRKYIDSVPAKPRYDVNCPDLYIPLMGYVTYLLVVGLVLGIQNRFDIEVLAKLASQSIAFIFLEIGIQLLTLYITNIQTNVTALELIALSGYKFIGIIIAALLSIAFYKKGYYAGIVYCSASLALFMVRTLKLQILSHYGSNDMSATGYVNDPSGYSGYSDHGGSYHSALMGKRQMYFLAFVAVSQPIFMWWLSFNLDANQ
ncbi:protein YIF1B-like [Cimex lectularius]|uniref:Protein YIF1 n=1 Tax=Cimex lectularius TaxID=79782 RepID=A0A8I6RJ54_CIMLE|nr:protein YIF1B-like [Cimex lectularius]